MKRAALHNLGCKVNACETQAMRELLEKDGYEIVEFTDIADVYVVNTCTVTQIADRKSRQMLHRARRLNPDAVIVAAGCYVESAKREGKTDDAVDIYIGNDEKSTLIPKLHAYAAHHETISCDSDIAHSSTFESLPVTRSDSHVRAFLKIEDGCNRFCSYCLIPYVRGRIRSLPPQEVLSQARALSEAGCREIVLDGIHLTSYGTDLSGGTEDACTDASLIGLLRRLEEVDGIERIRLGSLEPDYITEETADALSRITKLCPHFHLSLQSGCDSVLKRMNRRYTTDAFREKCNLLRTCFDHPALTTDVITGFPGETPQEFEATRIFLEEICFYQIHVFPYSPRKGTKAASMPGQVDSAVKKQRRDIICALTARQQTDYENALLGKTVRVLIEEEKEADGVMCSMGHTDEYVYASADGKPGEIIKGTLLRNTNGALKILALQ